MPHAVEVYQSVRQFTSRHPKVMEATGYATGILLGSLSVRSKYFRRSILDALGFVTRKEGGSFPRNPEHTTVGSGEKSGWTFSQRVAESLWVVPIAGSEPVTILFLGSKPPTNSEIASSVRDYYSKHHSPRGASLQQLDDSELLQKIEFWSPNPGQL